MYVGLKYVTIGKRYTFEAAHRLPKHPGKCQRPHGHSYVLEVDFTGPVQILGPQGGMVLDYYLISEMVKREVVDKYDHQDLNQALKFKFIYLDEHENSVQLDPDVDNCTTAENMVTIFADLLQRALYELKVTTTEGLFQIRRNITISRVRLCETASSWAEVKF